MKTNKRNKRVRFVELALGGGPPKALYSICFVSKTTQIFGFAKMAFRYGFTTADAAINVAFDQVLPGVDWVGYLKPKQSVRLRLGASELLG